MAGIVRLPYLNCKQNSENGFKFFSEMAFWFCLLVYSPTCLTSDLHSCIMLITKKYIPEKFEGMELSSIKIQKIVQNQKVYPDN